VTTVEAACKKCGVTKRRGRPTASHDADTMPLMLPFHGAAHVQQLKQQQEMLIPVQGLGALPAIPQQAQLLELQQRLQQQQIQQQLMEKEHHQRQLQLQQQHQQMQQALLQQQQQQQQLQMAQMTPRHVGKLPVSRGNSFTTPSEQLKERLMVQMTSLHVVQPPMSRGNSFTTPSELSRSGTSTSLKCATFSDKTISPHNSMAGSQALASPSMEELLQLKQQLELQVMERQLLQQLKSLKEQQVLYICI
jgi:hypothetical protein